MLCRLAQAIYSLTHLCNAVWGRQCVVWPSGQTGKCTCALMPCDLPTRGRVIRSLHTLGPYRYTLDLLQLDSNRSPFPDAVELRTDPPLVSRFIQNWEELLEQHQDRQYRDYILAGLREGFRVGFSWSQGLSPVKHNIPSAYTHPQAVKDYIRGEVAAGNFIRPLSSPVLSSGQSLHISRIGVIPKGRSSGKWRVITDLSYPSEGSINDGIDAAACSLEYTSVDRVAAAAWSLGRGAQLAKIDIKSAYRIISVHVSDRPLLGIFWRGKYYVDARLPFGLRSTPKVFNAVADALEWCFRRRGVEWVDHYLDDFIVLGPPNSEVCAHSLCMVREVAERLGISLAEKCEGPCTALTFLGIHIDTVQMTLSLPAEKLVRIQEELERWSGKKFRWCRRQELELLIGLLHHAARVVRPGRSFLYRLISLLRGRHDDVKYIRLKAEARTDILWWRVFIKIWNGVAISPVISTPQAFLTSDASGNWGCGAFTGSKWFQFQWTPEYGLSEQITFKELLPIVLAVIMWGKHWAGLHLHCNCDNEAVVHILASCYTRDSSVMHLLRCLFFYEAYYAMHISATHVPGHANGLADDLSRNRLSSFFLQAPHMSPLPVPLPLLAPDLLFNTRAMWSSPAWINSLQATLLRE